MTDKEVDYTPNSFNKSEPHDFRFNTYEPSVHKFKYNSNYVLLDTPALNAADAESIMNGLREYEASKPDNLLNDPILNRAFANDPSVANLVATNPMIFGDKKKLLIDMGNVKENEPKLYENFINGNIDDNLKEDFLRDNIDNPNVHTTGLLTSDVFFLESPSILYRNGNYLKIIPTKSMSKIEILNALTRFFIYVAVLYMLFSSDYSYLYVPIIAIIAIIILYYIQKSDVRDEKKEKICRPDGCANISVCQPPINGNPFMNVTMADLMDNRTRPSACIATDAKVDEKINEIFNYNLFRDVDDVFNRNNNQRQFYTMPSTTIPNDQTSFANWLYKRPQTCKENQYNCLEYEDIRFNRFNPNIDRFERIQEEIL